MGVTLETGENPSLPLSCLLSFEYAVHRYSEFMLGVSELPEPVVWCNPLTHEWLLPFLLFIPEPSIMHVLCLLWLPTYLGYFLLSLCLLFGSPWDCSVCFQTFFICLVTFLLIAGHDVQGKEIPSTGL